MWRLPAPLRADDVIFDAASHRSYVPGGEGFVGVYDTVSPGHLKLVAKVKTVPGAKTVLRLPGNGQLMLAASPGDTKNATEVLTFTIH